MTLEIPRISGRERPFPAFAALETLEELPSRRHPDPSAGTASLQWSRIGTDRYEVRFGGRTLGFIDVVGAVFVVLEGSPYGRAVETAQTLVFEEALSFLTRDR